MRAGGFPTEMQITAHPALVVLLRVPLCLGSCTVWKFRNRENTCGTVGGGTDKRVRVRRSSHMQEEVAIKEFVTLLPLLHLLVVFFALPQL